jgi:thymidine kinase
LSSKQQFFVDSALYGKNIFLTGAAGAGKTFVINEVVRRLRQQGKQVAVTSSTGNTAVAIEGQTLYSLVGCGLCESTQDLRKMWGRRDEWRSIDVLIVDEVSMIQVRLKYCAFDLFPIFSKNVDSTYPAERRCSRAQN